MIWLEGTKTLQTGTSRAFISPPLEAGHRYVYEIRARWQQDGKEVEQAQTVTVRAGSRVRVLFPTAPEPETLPDAQRVPNTPVPGQ
jgi:uncharacterized protein (TIGR03000 family)